MQTDLTQRFTALFYEVVATILKAKLMINAIEHQCINKSLWFKFRTTATKTAPGGKFPNFISINNGAD